MANVPIWPGSSNFFPGNTPFGFYDNDQSFQTDSEMVATWCASRLGYPLVDIELQAVNLFTCFEEAINEYGSQLYHFQIINKRRYDSKKIHQKNIFRNLWFRHLKWLVFLANGALLA